MAGANYTFKQGEGYVNTLFELTKSVYSATRSALTSIAMPPRTLK